MAKSVLTILRTPRGFRWRLREHRNARIIGASSEAYRDRADCVRNIARVTGLNLAPFLWGLSRDRYEFVLSESEVTAHYAGYTRVDRTVLFRG